MTEHDSRDTEVPATRFVTMGAVTQAALAVAWLSLGSKTGAPGCFPAAAMGFAGAVLWGHVALTLHWRRKLKGLEADLARKPDETANRWGDSDSRTDPALRVEWACEWAGLIKSIGETWLRTLAGAALLWPMISSFGGRTAVDPAVPVSQPVAGLVSAAILGLVCFAVLVFLSHLACSDEGARDREGLGWWHAHVWTGALLCAGFAGQLVGWRIPHRVAAVLLIASAALVGVELLMGVALGFFRPRSKGVEAAPAFSSRLLATLAGAKGLRAGIVEALDYQFGFAVSKTTLPRLVGRTAGPLFIGLASVLVLLSCMVIVEPSEHAVILRFGRCLPGVLGPGLHLKAPWPIDVAVVENTGRIRQTHVGSHFAEAGQEVYRPDVPILWDNLHGLSEENLMIVAPPADIARRSTASRATAPGMERKRPPTVSMIGGDVSVQYRIRDLGLYVRSFRDPEATFRAVAETAASRELFRHDIDRLLGAGRNEAAERMAASIQEESDSLRLGIEVLHVGIPGIHPPQQTAAAFHDTVIARQRRETSIQNAESHATHLLVEAFGDEQRAKDLLASMADSETESEAAVAGQTGKTLPHDGNQALLEQGGGRVAGIFADALAYRWWRELQEGGKAERFGREIALLRIGPTMYPMWRYMATMENGIRNSRKYVLLSHRDRSVLRFNFAGLEDGVGWLDDTGELDVLRGEPGQPAGSKTDLDKEMYEK